LDSIQPAEFIVNFIVPFLPVDTNTREYDVERPKIIADVVKNIVADVTTI